MSSREVTRVIPMFIYGCNVEIGVTAIGSDPVGAVNWVQNALEHYNRYLLEQALKEQEEQLLSLRMVTEYPEELRVDPAVIGRPFGQQFTDGERWLENCQDDEAE